jgi:uncharacterized protein YggE
MIRFLSVFALVLGVAAAPVLAADRATITVTGTGTAEAAPDIATLRVGVTSEAKTARAAMDQTNARTAAIIARMAGLGVAERDMQTSGLSVNPVWSNRPAAGGQTENSITGFVARNGLTLRVRDLAVLGEVIDRAVDDGANDIGGVSFDVDEPAPLLDAARRDAVADAMARAQLYAEAAGVTLGTLQSLSEQGGYAPQPRMMEMAMARDSGAPIARGEVGFSASVTMVFSIGE